MKHKKGEKIKILWHGEIITVTVKGYKDGVLVVE